MALDAVPLALSVIVRALAIYGKWFLSRPEVSTPLNSWSRLTEGVYLYNKGNNPSQKLTWMHIEPYFRVVSV